MFTNIAFMLEKKSDIATSNSILTDSKHFHRQSESNFAKHISITPAEESEQTDRSKKVSWRLTELTYLEFGVQRKSPTFDQ